MRIRLARLPAADEQVQARVSGAWAECCRICVVGHRLFYAAGSGPGRARASQNCPLRPGAAAGARLRGAASAVSLVRWPDADHRLHHGSDDDQGDSRSPGRAEVAATRGPLCIAARLANLVVLGNDRHDGRPLSVAHASVELAPCEHRLIGLAQVLLPGVRRILLGPTRSTQFPLPVPAPPTAGGPRRKDGRSTAPPSACRCHRGPSAWSAPASQDS